MIKSTLCACLALTMLLCGSATAQTTDAEWTLTLSKNDISVYTRKVPGSKILETKAEAKLKGNIDNMLSLYLDASTCSSWVPSCQTGRLLEKKSENNLIIYREIAIPWPFKNQEYVIEQTVSRSEETGEVLVEYEDLKDYPTGTDCCRRYRSINGYWKFTPTDDHVLVTYQVHFVPGGSFPSSAINSKVPETLIDIISSLEKNAANQ